MKFPKFSSCEKIPLADPFGCQLTRLAPREAPLDQRLGNCSVFSRFLARYGMDLIGGDCGLQNGHRGWPSAVAKRGDESLRC